MRIVTGFFGGLLAAAVMLFVVSQIGAALFPVTGLDADARDPERFSAVFAGAPLGTKLSLILSFFLAGWAGAATARMVSGRGGLAWVVAGLLALLGLLIVNIIALPAWLQILLPAAPLIGGLLGRHIPAATHPTAVRQEHVDASL